LLASVRDFMLQATTAFHTADGLRLNFGQPAWENVWSRG